jgi:hypothetical protein
VFEANSPWRVAKERYDVLAHLSHFIFATMTGIRIELLATIMMIRNYTTW